MEHGQARGSPGVPDTQHSVSRFRQQWLRLYAQKQNQLFEEKCDEALSISGIDEFQEYLRKISANYTDGRAPHILDRLQPGLDHVQSFTSAISSASQLELAAALVWGSLQAAIQCAISSVDTLEKIVHVLSELNQDFSVFKQDYLDIFRENPVLQYVLQDIYDVYMDFCMSIVVYLSRRNSQTDNFVRFSWTVDPTTLLEKTRAQLDKHYDRLKWEADLIYRQDSNEQSQQHIQHLNILQILSQDSVLISAADHFPISTVTMFKNYTFSGRDDIIKEMVRIFKSSPGDSTSAMTNGVMEAATTGPVCCVLHGLGGIGKTQIALAYHYHTEGDYDAVFWIPANNTFSLTQHYMEIAEKLHLMKDTSQISQDRSRAIASVREWLIHTKRKWLLIFDNVEDINEVKRFLPKKTNNRGHVLMTTQYADLDAITDQFERIRIENFNPDAGAALLFKHLQRKPRDEEENQVAKQISEDLGGLPLAISTICGYINDSNISLEEFKEDFSVSTRAWKASASGPVSQYEKTLESVFKKALEELPENARLMLQIMSFLDPDNIPEDLFLSSRTGDGHFTRTALTEAERVLRKRQLIRRNSGGSGVLLSTHRIVQWNVLMDLSTRTKDKYRWKVFNITFNLLRERLPKVSAIDNPAPESWALFKKYVPQILSMRTHCLWPEPPIELPDEFAQVMSNIATFMWHAGLMREGHDALMTAERILDAKGASKENPLRGNIHQHISIIASFNGVSQRREAMERRYKAIEARRAAHAQIPKGKITQEDEIRLWNVQSDMAFGLMQQESFEQAEEYIEKCHRQYQQWGTPVEIPFEYLKYHHVISYIRMVQGEPLEAIRHCKTAADLSKRCAGSQHPMTQLCLFSLTNYLYLAGELDEALKMSDQILESRSRVCGEVNHLTLESHAMCGFLRLANGEPAKAKQHLENCVDKHKSACWNSEGVARAQYIYSLAAERMGNDDEATSLRNEAFQTRDHFVKKYSEFLRPDPRDHMVVFDQMVSLWGGRFTGRLAAGGSAYRGNVFMSASASVLESVSEHEMQQHTAFSEANVSDWLRRVSRG